MVWAQAGIEDSLESFSKSLANVDSILLGRATYEDLVRKWPKVREWPQVSDVILRIGEKINAAPKLVVTGKHPLENLEWGEFDPPTQLTGANIEEQIKELKEGDGGLITPQRTQEDNRNDEVNLCWFACHKPRCVNAVL